jgi:predicted DNA-binding transcriptional regulator YafY
VRRYAEHLINLDVPVESVRGRYGGYRLGRRLDAVLGPLAFTDAPGEAPGEAPAPDTGILLSVADAVRHRRPVSIRYTAGDGRRSERTLRPYGLVAHAGRWYVTARIPASARSGRSGSTASS